MLLSRHLKSCNKMPDPQRDLPEAPVRGSVQQAGRRPCLLGVGVDKGSTEKVAFVWF